MSLGLDESKGGDTTKVVETHYRKLLLVWLVILSSLVGIFIVSRLLQPTHEGPKVLFWILLAIGLGNLGASFIVKDKILKQATAEGKPAKVFSGYVVAYALCESLGLFGFVIYLVTGIEYYYFFFVLAGFGMILHKPQRNDVVAAIGPDWN